MDNLKRFEKLVKELCETSQSDLPEMIRELVNKPVYREMLEAQLLGALLVLNDDISLTGYKTGIVDNATGKTGSWCTQIKNCHTDKFIIS